ncbi:MAG: (d)CMP kinase [Erysipelotrichaceae bacterium]|nr:(d)CMP kinase [Erysipelotrichaceae bacterium]
MRNFVVAIDGPAGSGKSSISKLVAKSRGFTHLDTGAMYRAVTLEALNRGIDLADENAYSFLDKISVVYKNGIIYLNGKDVSKEIRTEIVTNNVSTAAKHRAVREVMVKFQRESAKEGKVLVDGRDIGTVVFPNADLKIFLTATAEERARRRCLENEKAGIESNYEIILEEIKARDFKDSNREISPLKQAADAILIDTTKMNIDEVSNTIIKLIDERYNNMENFSMDNLSMPKKLRAGDKVEGVVVSVTDNTIYLDIQSYTEGTMHLDHYTKDNSIDTFKGIVKVGDIISCEVAKVTEDNIYLSRLNQISVEWFKKVVDAYNDGKDVEVLVKNEGKNGYNVVYMDNLLFMPKSHSTASVEVGKNITVRFLEIDEAKKRAVVSRRVIEQEIYQDKKSKELDSINVGDVVTGTISKVEKYGAIVKLEYNQGLLRANQVAHTFVDVEKELKVGQQIEVKVVGKENGKINFSKKALLKTPFELFLEQYKVSDKVKGKVVNKLAFGLLLEIAPNVKGLLHASEYSHNPNDNFNNHVVIGDEVEAAIISITPNNEKVSLSRKALMDNPWARVEANVGDLVDVKVTQIKENGLIVEALGVDGFIPANEAVLDFKKDNLSAYYAIGDEAKAYITEIKPAEWKLKLTIRKYLVEEDRKSYEKYLGEEKTENVTIGDMFKDLLK